ILHLPPYSPDYQPIELAFHVIKAHLQQEGLHCFKEDQIFYKLYAACGAVTPEMTWGFWHHCSY
ncbi:hypothetical protein BT96DRAFT_773409, partial [Gymnopus androsaceus JB14]